MATDDDRQENSAQNGRGVSFSDGKRCLEFTAKSSEGVESLIALSANLVCILSIMGYISVCRVLIATRGSLFVEGTDP